MIHLKHYSYEEKEDEIGIYLPAGDGVFRYSLKHIVKPFADGGTHQNQDLWRLHKTHLFTRMGDDFLPVYDFPITNGGEWECAVRIVGTPDFHGGFHGYEKLLSTSFRPEEECLFFSQESRIVLQGTENEPVAFHRKEYEFRDGAVFLKQYLEWERSVEIDRAFLTMLPIRRMEGDFSITDTALWNGEEYDIAKEGHKTPISSGCKEKGTSLTVLGKKSGIRATVTSSLEKSLFVQNTAAYNKIYFC